jgi:hypothetical protein
LNSIGWRVNGFIPVRGFARSNDGCESISAVHFVKIDSAWSVRTFDTANQLIHPLFIPHGSTAVLMDFALET